MLYLVLARMYLTSTIVLFEDQNIVRILNQALSIKPNALFSYCPNVFVIFDISRRSQILCLDTESSLRP